MAAASEKTPVHIGASLAGEEPHDHLHQRHELKN
jgi:hypothetical protein